jgi:fructose-specific component phosphotransferase system IIB-like protein
LKSTVYSTGEKVLNQKDDANGMQVSDEQATCKSFYAETLGWDMTSVWKFVKAGQYPVLVYMDYGFPAQEVSVSETGYATFVAEAELEIPEGVEVFAVQLNGEKAHLEPIENAIPAGEAVVVKATANTYEFAYAVEYAEKVSGNELKAAVADVVADGTQYVLADGAEGIGFYQVKAGSTIVAGKGYLEISAANGAKGFYGFESGDATGISDIDANIDANAVIYNLSGQRIQKAQKGINIVNGKKLLK